MHLLIEKIDRTRTVLNQEGKTLKKLGVYANSRWYGCFQSNWNATWKEGDEIDVEVKEVKTQDGRSFWNILPPQKTSAAMDELLTLARDSNDMLKELTGRNKKPPFGG